VLIYPIRFVVSFHVLDSTISIFEPKVPNVRGGTYLERTKVGCDNLMAEELWIRVKITPCTP